jgi:hypothetical protein
MVVCCYQKNILLLSRNTVFIYCSLRVVHVSVVVAIATAHEHEYEQSRRMVIRASKLHFTSPN